MSIDSRQTCICSFCDKKIGFKPEQQNKRAKCPQCKRVVLLLDNSRVDIRKLLSSEWWVRLPKKVVLSTTLGPMSESEFAGMFEEGKLNVRCEVKSKRFTYDQWVIFNRSIMPPVIEEVSLKDAEHKRLTKIAERKRKVDHENKSRLRKFVQQAIADGQISSKEDSTIESFAIKARLNLAEVQQIVRTESEQMLQSILTDALEDGILAPDEEAQLDRFSKGLGIALNPTPRQTQLIVLSRLAYQLNMRELDEHPEIKSPFKLQAKEKCIAVNRLEWNEIVQLKRPKGTSLGDDRYLKPIAVGDCYLTTKRLVLESDFESKKATNTSVQRAACYRDGVFLNRSSGKSLFLRFLANDDLEHLGFALMLKRILTDFPLQGFMPEYNFVPVQGLETETSIGTKITEASASQGRVNKRSEVHTNEPRFTFRVVGDHVGDRSYWIKKLKPAEQLKLVREPQNQYDENAVLICNHVSKQLGYLKREVAAWFAPMLDHGKHFSASVLRIRPDGCLIVAIHD